MEQSGWTAGLVSGKPFWEALGFVNIGEKSPENKQDIYEKDVVYPDFDSGEQLPLSKEAVALISQTYDWSIRTPEWRQVLIKG